MLFLQTLASALFKAGLLGIAAFFGIKAGKTLRSSKDAK